MSVIIGKAAALREADTAAGEATEWAGRASTTQTHPKALDEAASYALISLAHSARELCWLARAALAHFIKPETK